MTLTTQQQFKRLIEIRTTLIELHRDLVEVDHDLAMDSEKHFQGLIGYISGAANAKDAVLAVDSLADNYIPF